MGTEDCILKGTKLITNTKKQILKIQSRGQTLKNTIFKKKTQQHKNKQTNTKTPKNKTQKTNKKTQITEIIKYIIYEVCFKNRSFFCKVIGYKNEN